MARRAESPARVRHRRADIEQAVAVLRGKSLARSHAEACRIIEDCIEDMYALARDCERRQLRERELLATIEEG